MARMPNQKYKSKKQVSKRDVKKIVKEEMYKNSETKSKSIETAEVRVSSNRDVDPLMVQLTDIEMGGRPYQRSGNECTIIGVKNRMLLHAVANQLADPIVNVAVVVREALIRSPFSQEDTLDQLFIKNNDTYAWSQSNQGEKYLLPFNHNELDILYQKTHKLGKENATYTNQYYPNKIVKWYRKQDQQIRFQETVSTGDVAEANHNYFYVLFCINANLDYAGTGETGAGAVEVTSLLTTYYKDI